MRDDETVDPGPPVERPLPGEDRPDERIRSEVCQRLAESGTTTASRIHVSVINGEVTLEGTVPSQQVKESAQYAASQVRDATEIRNLLHVAQGEDRPS